MTCTSRFSMASDEDPPAPQKASCIVIMGCPTARRFTLLRAAGAGEQHPVAEALTADRLEAVAVVEAGGSSVVGDQPQVVGLGVGDDLMQ